MSSDIERDIEKFVSVMSTLPVMQQVKLWQVMVKLSPAARETVSYREWVKAHANDVCAALANEHWRKEVFK